MLSISAVQRAVGARAVLVYRHPGAALASYRRMGWTPDTEELAPIVSKFLADYGPSSGVALPGEGRDDVGALAWFWNCLYGMALRETTPSTAEIVSHRDLAIGGEDAARSLFHVLDLKWTKESQALIHPSGVRATDELALHNLHRDPATVADSWRDRLSAREIERLDAETVDVRRLLDSRRVPLIGATAT